MYQISKARVNQTMKFLLSFVTFLSAVFLIQGRSYGYAKKKIVKKPVVVPDTKIPHCQVACTLQWISPECREETYGFENGVKCKGCDRDICRGPIGGVNVGLDNWQSGGNVGLNNWQNGQNWQSGGNGGLDSWQNGQNWQSGLNGGLGSGQNGQNWQSGVNGGLGSWQNGQNWQSGGNWRGDGFINQGQIGGFLDPLQNNNILNQGQW